MRKSIAVLTFVMLAGMVAGCARSATVRVMSYNIRVETPADGEHQWMHRRDAVGAMLREQRVDLLGAQEATAQQTDDLAECLEGYDWVGVARDGGKRPEFCPIFYRAAKFELLEHGVFWLSEQPDAPGSRGWDAAFPRVAMWAKFRDRHAGRAFLMVNTHFDHRGRQARAESAKLILRRLAGMSNGSPIILTGDLNCRPESEPYRLLTESLRDARLTSKAGHAGPVETFTGWLDQAATTRPGRATLDYILVSPDVEVERTATLPDDRDGRQLSDHRAILADLKL